jgi:hypothetical protein
VVGRRTPRRLVLCYAPPPTKLFSHFSPRFARAEMAVLSKPE